MSDRSNSPVVYIGIGNSDGKLSQARWATFSSFVRAAVSSASRAGDGEILGEWYSPPNSRFQNACLCIRLPIDPDVVDKLKDDLADLGRYFDQDCVSWSVAPVTEFLTRPVHPPAAPAAVAA